MKPSLFLSSALLSALLIAAPFAAQAQEGGYNSAAIMNYEQRLSAVEDQIRTLTGKTEQVDFMLRRINQALERMQSDNDMRLAKLEQVQNQMLAAQQMTTASQQQAQLAAAQAPVAQPQQQRAPSVVTHEDDEELAAEANGTLGAIKMQNGKVTGGVKDPKATPLPKTPADYGLNAQEQYDRAFGLLRQASYEDAEKAFKAFIDKNPKDKMLDNAKYWYAETFYVRGKYSDSAVAFADAFQQNPKGTKAPDSLLKLSMALAALDKVPDACVTLGELKTKYPNAPATIRTRADQERSRLKCK